MKRALILFALALAPCALNAADSCTELADKVKSLEVEIVLLQRQLVGRESRLTDCQGAVAAAFEERRTMKQAASAGEWAAAAYRLLLELHLALGVAADHPLSLDRGDPMKPVEDAVQAAMADGVMATERADAARVAALGARAASRARLTTRFTAAATEALRVQLELMQAAHASQLAAVPLPAPPASEKLTRRYDQPDVAFDAPELAGRATELRDKAAALDTALATLALAAEKEPHPADSIKVALEKTNAELDRDRAALAGCKGN